jgi:hypothetical protein
MALASRAEHDRPERLVEVLQAEFDVGQGDGPDGQRGPEELAPAVVKRAGSHKEEVEQCCQPGSFHDGILPG